MPARKSNHSAPSPTEDGAPSARESRESAGLSVEDLSLPRTMIQRLAKGVLPPNTQIQKDALLAMSKSATVFVNYLTSHAYDYASRANKKTVQPKDVMDAMAEIEFEQFLPRLEAELQKYNAVQCDKRNTYRRKVREEKKAQQSADTQNPGEDSMVTVESSEARRDDGDSPPAAKKMRRTSQDEGGKGDQSGAESEFDQAENEDVEAEEEHEDEVEEDEDESEHSGAEDELAEDPIELREGQEAEDEALDGDESD